MDRRQFVVADLQSSRLPDPRQRPLHDPADLAQPAAVRCSRPRQVVLDPSPLQPLAVARRPVLPVAVQGIRPTASAAARLADQRDVIEQRHRQERFVPVGTRDPHRQRVPFPLTSRWRFEPFLARSVGFGPVRAPQKRRDNSGCPPPPSTSRSTPRDPGGRGGRGGASSRRPAAASNAAVASRSRRSRSPSPGVTSTRGSRSGGRR